MSLESLQELRSTTAYVSITFNLLPQISTVNFTSEQPTHFLSVWEHSVKSNCFLLRMVKLWIRVVYVIHGIKQN